MKRFCILGLVVLFLISGCASDQQKAEKFIKEGKAFVEKQDYAKAVIQLKNAVKLDPKSAEAYRLLAQVHLQQKNPQDAFAAFLRLEQLEPASI